MTPSIVNISSRETGNLIKRFSDGPKTRTKPIFLTEKDARWFLEAEAMINREEGMIFNVLRTTTVMVMEE